MKAKLSKNLPTNVAAASARSCYSSTIVTPEKVENWEKKVPLLKDLFKSGHHTTMQHTTFTFEIEGMSRLLIWRLLHSHAHYNSDQVSQRYAKIGLDESTYYYPESVDKDKTQVLFAKLHKAYTQLTEKLTAIYEKDENKVIQKIANKKAMEMARYVLPQATKAHLFHSINFITALRYIKAADIIPEADTEAKEFAKIIEDTLIAADPAYEEIILIAKKQNASFPNMDFSRFPALDIGEDTKVFDITTGHGLPDSENYANGLNMNALFYPTETLSSFTIRMRLSLSADAQNQRHRTSLGLREPLLVTMYNNTGKTPEDKCYIPDIILQNEELHEIYMGAIEEAFTFIDDISKECNPKDIPYFLPNAFQIEVIEKNDISNFSHKAKLRTCLNAQEEIRDLTEDIIKQLDKENLEEIDYLVPPCVSRSRNGINPACSEGARFCGIKLWKDKKYEEGDLNVKNRSKEKDGI